MKNQTPKNHHTCLDSLICKPLDREFLRGWISLNLGLELPRKPLCPHHNTPLDYLEHAFFELPGDPVVWACRGGGKTMLGAVATLLDLIHKPGIQIRILGGSLDQSHKMYAYLRQLLSLSQLQPFLKHKPTSRKLSLTNGSQVEILAQSDTSVRGQRVQKLRCDEVDLFHPDVWSAAQLVTRSTTDNLQQPVKASIEAFSTMHVPCGLMQSLTQPQPATPARPTQNPRRIFQWCIWDVIEHCPESRSCSSCPLWNQCQGRAKLAHGFVPIDDVIAMRSRVSASVWNHEMLCHPPRHHDAVFPAFNPHLHVALPPAHLTPDRIVAAIDFGYAGAFVCLFVAFYLDSRKKLRVHVLDELLTKEFTLERSLSLIKQRQIPFDLIACDPAGNHPNDQTGRTNIRILKDAGFTVHARASTITEGLAHIEALLSPADTPSLPNSDTPSLPYNPPTRLQIHPQCTHLIQAFQSYRRAPDGTPIKDGTADHPLDALRYALLSHHPKPQTKTRAY